MKKTIILTLLVALVAAGYYLLITKPKLDLRAEVKKYQDSHPLVMLPFKGDTIQSRSRFCPQYLPGTTYTQNACGERVGQAVIFRS